MTSNKKKATLVSNENSTTTSMDSLVKFCDENKLLKTPFVIADVTIPPENVPCFDYLVLFAIVVFLLFFLLIAYCCYRCRLKRRWVGEMKKKSFSTTIRVKGQTKAFVVVLAKRNWFQSCMTFHLRIMHHNISPQ